MHGHGYRHGHGGDWGHRSHRSSHWCGGSWPFDWMAGAKFGSFRHRPPPPGAPPGPPGMPPWFNQFFGGPPPRAERGEVRYLILDALSEQPRHGYEVIQTIESRSGGAYRPSPGTVYPTLQMLEEMGMVQSSEPEGRKKLYELTSEGRKELEEHREEIEEAYQRLSGEALWDEIPDLFELGHRVHQLIRRVGRAVRRGRISPKKWKEIEELLSRAADGIEEVLKRD